MNVEKRLIEIRIKYDRFKRRIKHQVREFKSYHVYVEEMYMCYIVNYKLSFAKNRFFAISRQL